MSYVKFNVSQVTFRPMEDHQEGYALLVKLPNGKLVHFYRSASNDEWVAGVILYQSSGDGGYTWDTPKQLTPSDPDTDYAISGGVTPAGTILVCLWKISNSQRKSVGLFVVRSTDEGHSWSDPVAIPGDYHVTYGQLIVTPNAVALPCYRYPFVGAQFTCDLVFSYDDGLTWPDPHHVADATHPTFGNNECAFLWTHDSTLLGFMRSTRWDHTMDSITDAHSLVFMYTRDNGVSWVFKETNLRPSYIPYGSQLLTWELISPTILSPGLNSDQITLVFAEREQFNPTQNLGILRAVSVRPEDVILNNGWLGPSQHLIGQELWRGDSNDFGYPTLQETPVGPLGFFNNATNPGGQINPYCLRMQRV